jgi:hypothetical protein
MRVSNVPRSSNWVWAVYQNIASNSTFTSFSSVSGVVPPPPTVAIASMVAGQPTFQIGGVPGYSYTLQASSNLVAWADLLVTNPVATPFYWTDTSATNHSRRFYRALIGP